MSNHELLKEIREKVEYLNHQVTENTTDIRWLKRIQWWQLGLLVTILVGVLVKLLAG